MERLNELIGVGSLVLKKSLAFQDSEVSEVTAVLEGALWDISGN